MQITQSSKWCISTITINAAKRSCMHLPHLLCVSLFLWIM